MVYSAQFMRKLLVVREKRRADIGYGKALLWEVDKTGSADQHIHKNAQT